MKRTDSAIALGLFIASFVLYIRTLAPSLLFGDSAEFQTIAYTLGMGHPTGYPIYILLAKLFTFLPIGEIAYRVNLFSAFCAALTVGLVYLILRRIGAMSVAALYGSLALAFTSLFWKYASIAEVYAPSAACLALILLFVLQWKQTNDLHWLFLAGLLGGLSPGMHTTVALSGISILTYLLLSTRQTAHWFQASVGVMTGIVIFLASFLLLDSLNASAGYYNAVVRPSLSAWDMTPGDFDSPFERLAFLYFPPQFRGEFFSVASDQVKTRMIDFATESSGSRWLALLGFIALIVPRKISPARWREAILMIVAFITFLGFAITYDVHDFQVFYIHAILILDIFIGMGVNAIIEVVTWIPGLPRFLPALLAIGILTLRLYPSATGISAAWKERIPPMLKGWESYYKSPSEPRLEAEQVVSRIEDNAIVFTGWDKLYGFYYVSHLMQRRTEMTFHETFPQEGVTKFADSTIQYIEANIDVRPIYFTTRPSQLARSYKITRAASGLLRIERR
jgi:hypothetical protein